MIVNVEECRKKGHLDGETLEKVIRENTRLDDAGVFMHGKDALIIVGAPSSRNFLGSDNTDLEVVREGGEHVLVLTRELGHPLKYFIFDPTFLPDQRIAVVSSRISEIRDIHNGIIASLCGTVSASSRFSASYTFMGPAGYETRVPFSRPNAPTYRNMWGFGAEGVEEKSELDFREIADFYMKRIKCVLARQLELIPADKEVGVLFSGGIDSTSVLVLLYRLFEESGRDTKKLKAFSLAINGGGSDLPQSNEVLVLLKEKGIVVQRELYHKSTEKFDEKAQVAYLKKMIETVEDYKPANLQGIMGVNWALEAIRKKHPELKYLFSGNGADELGLSYELNDRESRYRPLTFDEVMKKPLMFVFGPHEPGGRVFNAHKGGAGLSREACYYTYVNEAHGFVALSPFLDKDVIEFAAGIPYAQLIPDEAAMASFKVRLETEGLNAIAGVDLPVFHKTRLQSGIAPKNPFDFVHAGLARQLYRDMFD